MARVQHLPLYSLAYAYVREVYRVKVKLPKLLRYDLGQEAFESSFKILKCIVLANKAQEKGRHLSRLLLETEVQWVALRLLYDLKGITEGEFKVLSERLSEIHPKKLKTPSCTEAKSWPLGCCCLRSSYFDK